MKNRLSLAAVLFAGLGTASAQSIVNPLRPPGVIVATSGNNYYPTIGTGPAASNAWQTSGFYSPSFVMQRSRITPIQILPTFGRPTRPLLPSEASR